MFKSKSFLLALLIVAPLACKPPFNPGDKKLYPTPDALYKAATAEYKAGHFDNAAKAFEQLTLDLVPSRVAYLIRTGSKTDFRRAVVEASTRWAGVTEAIIPVSQTGKVQSGWRQVAQTLQLNAAINIDLPIDSGRVAAESLGLPFGLIAGIDHGGTSSCHPLNVGPRASRPDVVLPSSDALWELTAAGTIPADQLADWGMKPR